MNVGKLMPEIDFIYFDLGKVILDFDHVAGCKQLAEVAGISAEEARAAIFDSKLADQYETGLINDDQFHAEFCRLTDSSGGKDEILFAISDIFTPVDGTFDLIAELKGIGFPIGILSNTCSAHWEKVSADYPVLLESFSPVILSYEVNSMKPDAKIYNCAIEQAGCHIKKCFFVDDRQENVDGANANGMDAVLFESAVELRHQLQRRGVPLP